MKGDTPFTIMLALNIILTVLSSYQLNNAKYLAARTIENADTVIQQSARVIEIADEASGVYKQATTSFELATEAILESIATRTSGIE